LKKFPAKKLPGKSSLEIVPSKKLPRKSVLERVSRKEFPRNSSLAKKFPGEIVPRRKSSLAKYAHTYIVWIM
jgi:hypothetical protein